MGRHGFRGVQMRENPKNDGCSDRDRSERERNSGSFVRPFRCGRGALRRFGSSPSCIFGRAGDLYLLRLGRFPKARRFLTFLS